MFARGVPCRLREKNDCPRYLLGIKGRRDTTLSHRNRSFDKLRLRAGLACLS